jgi:hypothetical protein
MKKMNIIGLLGSVLTIVSAWLPWVKVELMGVSESSNGFRGEMGGNPGVVFVAIGVLCAVFFLINKKWSNIISLIFSLCVLGLAIKYMGDAKSFGDMASSGLGLYVMAAGGALILVGAIMGMRGGSSTPTPAA